jgi:hypothetical protein
MRVPGLPQRRSTTHVERLHGELCLYEWTTKTVHALNPAAARVWDMCDGSTTIDEMTTAVRRDLSASGADVIVQHALVQFDRAGLLEPGTFDAAPTALSRRAVLRRIGIAAAIPVVTSIAAPTPLAAQSPGRTITFGFTGSPQSFVVPAGVTTLQVDAVGNSGTGIQNVQWWGVGGRVQARLPVTPGETLTITVGGNGQITAGGFNGGGAPGTNGLYGGGGATDIRRGSTKLIVAGGGAGAGNGGGNGGHGGGLVAGDGSGTCGGGGGGGTQSAGGIGGAAGGSGGVAGSPGASGQGGRGADAPAGSAGGGGGGGGYFGGGGGGSCAGSIQAGGGGGGSSYTDPSATNVVHTMGSLGNGLIPGVTLSW